MANVLVVDVANVMGSRPDGWWRDRPGAAGRLLEQLVPVIGTSVKLGEEAFVVHRVIAVVEGRSREAAIPERATELGLEVMAAPSDGDTSIVAAAHGVVAGGHRPIVVTADRGLRSRLPEGAEIAGPSWLLDVL